MPRRKNVAVGAVSETTVQHQKAATLDFERAVELFIMDQKIRHRAPRTIEWHRDNLHTLQKFLEIQNIPTAPRSISTKTLREKYVLYMLDTLKLSPVTVNGRIRTAKAFFRFLFTEDYIDRDPAAELVLLKAKKTIIQTFSREQIRSLLNAPNRDTFTGLRDYTIMLLLLETGMRISELTNLKMTDIRWEDNAILVLGKGNKERLVPFQRHMRQVLRRYVATRGEVPMQDHLFLNLDNRPLKKRHIQERIQDYGKAAGITGVRVSPHTFRHTFAKYYIKNGGDAFSLQAILGHTTLEMVRHYVNLFSSDVQEQHRKFSPVEHLNLM